MPKISVKARKHAKAAQQPKFSLDTISENRPRGRPAKIKANWVRGKADVFRVSLNRIWDRVAPRLLKALTYQDVAASFERADIGGSTFEFVQLADLILKVLKEPKFPKQNRKAQIHFLADSIGGHGSVTPRTSRDICQKERARIKKVHRILRYEYWIECSCRYKGPSLNHACPKCEAEIPLAMDLGVGGVAL